MKEKNRLTFDLYRNMKYGTFNTIGLFLAVVVPKEFVNYKIIHGRCYNNEENWRFEKFDLSLFKDWNENEHFVYFGKVDDIYDNIELCTIITRIPEEDSKQWLKWLLSELQSECNNDETIALFKKASFI